MKDKEKTKRPPVVVILGHVDHGKSSLLEAVKDLKITEKEAGGITQHIGAYVISHQGKEITFIDTPGHEAFFAMRSRGAKIADIGVLVVAADESIKEQTREAIKHLQEVKMPFLVAINKIDKKNINIERVKQDLSVEGVFVESYGGDVPSVNISAKEKIGIDELLEMILLLSEIEEKEENGEEKIKGAVLEVQRDPQKGMIATILTKNGELKKGDIIATKQSFGKIRVMENFLGEEVEKVGPSIPVRVTGIKGYLSAGEDFYVFEKLEVAKCFACEVGEKRDYCNNNGKKILNIILKADVAGSLEAIESSLKKIPQNEINIQIIKSDIGCVNESDIECSKVSGAKIFIFHEKADKAAEKMAIREEIEIRSFDIIYELIESVKESAESMLEEETIREEVGKVKILAVFRTQKNRQILGGKVLSGEAIKGAMVEVLRGEEKITEGKIINLKKGEKDMEKISESEEFGMLLESKGNVEEGDVLLFYKEEKIKKTL
jgi:translation initiation factor IF-2